MKYAHEEECEAAELDAKNVEALAAAISRLAKKADAMGITIFGGAGHGSLRINDDPGNSYSRPLILASLGGENWDGGDGGYGTRGDDGLMRGE